MLQHGKGRKFELLGFLESQLYVISDEIRLSKQGLNEHWREEIKIIILECAVKLDILLLENLPLETQNDKVTEKVTREKLEISTYDLSGINAAIDYLKNVIVEIRNDDIWRYSTEELEPWILESIKIYLQGG